MRSGAIHQRRLPLGGGKWRGVHYVGSTIYSARTLTLWLTTNLEHRLLGGWKG